MKNGKYRLRVRNIGEDQLETIFAVFEEVMSELDTAYANIGLEALCIHYQACRELLQIDCVKP